MLNTHEAKHGSSCCNPLSRSAPARGGAIAIGVLVLGGLSACAESQQSVKRYQPEPVRRAATPEAVVETPAREDYRERADAVERVCKRKASTDLGRCWSDEAVNRRKDPKFEARLIIEITVSPGGSATAVKVLNPNREQSSLEQCVIDSAKSWTYPDGQSEAVVQCPFWLRPGV